MNNINKMKNIKRFILLSLSLLFFITAIGCAPKKSEVEQIYEQSLSAMAKANSYDFTMDTKQSISLPVEGGSNEQISMQMVMNGSIMEQPLSMVMDVNVNLEDVMVPELADLQDASMQYFLVNNQLYMKNPLLGDIWLKEPIKNMDDLGAQLDPAYIAQNFNNGLENANVIEHGNTYVLVIEGTNDALKESFNEMISNIITEAGTEFYSEDQAGIMANTQINKLNMKLWIDKETYYQKRIDLELELEIVKDDQSMTIEQIIVGDYSNFGAIDEIVLPSDIQDNAVTIDEYIERSLPIYDLPDSSFKQ